MRQKTNRYNPNSLKKKTNKKELKTIVSYTNTNTSFVTTKISVLC